MLVLFTDTDTDLTPKEAEEFGYNLISMPYVIEDKEIYPYIDFDEFDYHTFYNQLRSGIIPKTCAINPEKYIEYFEGPLKEGNDVLYVHFSKSMSGTFNAMQIAIDELKYRYPKQTIYTIDTKGITLLSYNIVKEIGKLYKENKTIDEILQWADKEILKFAAYFYVDDLKFFQKSGRVSGFSGFMGNILGIHPIIHINSEGNMVSIGKERGRVATLKRIVSYVVELQEDIEKYPIIITHSDCLSIAMELKKMLQNSFADKKLKFEFQVVNPTAGSHCGPSAVGVCFHAKHR